VCPSDVQECPDGSYVSRDGNNNCEFQSCYDHGRVCPTDVSRCPDGSYVSRNPDDNCYFQPCPRRHSDRPPPPRNTPPKFYAAE